MSKKVLVRNISDGVVSFNAGRVERIFEFQGAEHRIDTEDLFEFANRLGGRTILEEYLLIQDEEVIEELGLHIDMQNFASKDEIKALLKKSKKALVDALEEATEVFKDNVVATAIEEKLADYDKVEAIKEATGVDVIEAIKEKREEEKEAPKKPTRRGK